MRVSALNTWLLKLGLTLPLAVLRFLAGGGVVHNRGRTLDAQIQFLWRGLFTNPTGRAHLSLTGKSLESARVEWQETIALFGLPDDIRVRYEVIEGGASISGLLIRPAHVSEDAPLLVFFHQGGGVIGGPDLSKAFCALLAHTAHCPVFLPDYRLAPLNRFPAALEDARAAYDWALANAARLGAKSGQVAIGGALIGANLAARISLDLRRDFKPFPVGQLLITPLVDLADPLIKANAALGMWPLTVADLDLMISHYAGAGTDLTDPRISPASEKLIIGQPKTFIVSAGLDPLAAQGEAFAKRLIAARNVTLYRRYDSLPLGFDLFAAVADEARSAVQDIAENWMDLLRNGQIEIAAEPTQDVA
ncbi:alpha/beta hydrolase [Asticcacaulis sp.]|uniref:alpha/beta hydrolase n=1 Tax=Asticcacaulis sp. TaxID=1872648 RepID=UPI002B5DA3B2|nr:alpha/beta hydrolase [Asticcacaulis sp.]HTM79955.1 alpha/beta hydrolase [Asticcacaulis sp.]